MINPCHGILLILKKNEILIHAATWMNIENIVISEKSQNRAFHDNIYIKYPEK